MSLFTLLKTLFLCLILLNIGPSLVRGIHKQYSRYFSPQMQVGVIAIKDTISSSTEIIEHVTEFFKEPEIKAILLKIECAGGSAGSSQALYYELMALKKAYPKPVVVLVENICTSGAYYIATAADVIVAPGMAIIGSIGAYMPCFFQLRKLLEEHNINYTALKAGAYKGSGDMFTDFTPQEQAQLQGVVNDTYNQLVSDIAANRNLDIKAVGVWADGKLFSGRQAFELGLIDHIGSFATAQTIIKQKALIEHDIEWIYPTGNSIWTRLFGISSDDNESLLSSWINTLCSTVMQRTRGMVL